MTRTAVTSALTLLLICAPSLATPQESSSQAAKPTFRSAVDLVSVAAVVRDKRGRFARNLRKEDFVVQEGGTRREIVDFRADENAPVRVALLFDVSGSMRLADRLEASRQAARQLLSALRLGSSPDEAAVFSFDMNLQSLQPFTADAGAIETALSRVAPYGQTSLYDAIAQTARQVADTKPSDRHRRAVVVFTDGQDTSSLMKPEEVSAIASGIDVPVYIFAVVTSVDDPRESEDQRRAATASNLQELARNTGGELLISSSPAQASIAARQIISELRHQYVLAIEASARAGWRPLEIRMRKDSHVVRARSGYNGANPSSDPEYGAAGAADSGPAVRMGSGRS
jgi:VWFA-related protein